MAIDTSTSGKRSSRVAPARGLTLPEPLPHPDDIVIDMKIGQVGITGPMTKEDKAEWDRIWDQVEECDRSIGELTAGTSSCARTSGIAKSSKTTSFTKSASGRSSSTPSASQNDAARRGRKRAVRPDRHFVLYLTEADAQAHQQTHLRQAGFISGSAHRELVMASGERSGAELAKHENEDLEVAPSRAPELRRSAVRIPSAFQEVRANRRDLLVRRMADTIPRR